MRSIFLSILLGLSVSAKGAAQTTPADRETLVTAAYRALPTLVNYVAQLKSFDKLLNEEGDRRLFRQVKEIAASGKVPIVFSNDRASFHLNPDEPERLMRSTAIQDEETGQNLDNGQVLVNRALLYELEKPDLTTILKLLFHEIAHKTPETNWGVRDRMAQVFESQISPHITVSEVNANSDLIVLSLPSAKIDTRIGAASANEPLPSNILLLRLGDGYLDLTDNLQQRTAHTTALMRSMWAEANRVIFMIMSEMSKAMTQALKPMMDGFLKPMMQVFGGNPDKVDEAFGKLNDLDVGEIRTLELHDARTSAIENGIFISLKATYIIGRTGKYQMPIQVDGFPWQESYPVPVMIHIVVPTDAGQDPEQAQVDVQMRPNADYLTAAKAYGISRQGGVISTLKVRFKEETADAIERVDLISHYGMGHLTLDAAKIEKLDNGHVEATFDIPPSFYPAQVALVADAILINSERTLFLDRLITLSGDDGQSVFVPRQQSNNEFISGSVGIWGLQNGKPAFRNHFEFREPIWIIDNVKAPNFTLNHSQLKVEFQLQKEQKIREIRLYMKRMLIGLDTKPNDGEKGPEISTTEINGQTYRFANGGKLKQQKDVHDITSIDANEIYSAYLPNGKQKVQATLSIPFRLLESVDGPDHAYAPPMGYPVLLEVVTENLQTMRYYFQDPNAPVGADPCEEALSGLFKTSNN